MGDISRNDGGEVETNIHKNKNKNVKLIIIICLCIFIVGTGGYFGFQKYKNYEIRKDPALWIKYGVASNFSQDTLVSNTETKFKINLPDSIKNYSSPDSNDYSEDTSGTEDITKIKIASALINNMTMETKTMSSKSLSQNYYEINIIYKKTQFISMKLFVDKEGIVVSCPKLYNENLFINWKDINKLQNVNSDSSYGTINFQNYQSVLRLDTSKYYKDVNKKYLDSLSQKFDPKITKKNTSDVAYVDVNGKNKTVACDELDMDMTSSELNDIVKDLVLQASSDPNVKSLIKDKVKEFISVVDKNNDYSKWGFTKEDAKKFWDDFDNNYDEGVSDIKDGTENMESQEKDISSTLNFKFKIDSSNKLKEMDYKATVKSTDEDLKGFSFSINQITKIDSSNSEVTVGKVSKSGAEDLSKLDKYKQNDILDEVEKNLLKLAVPKSGQIVSQ